MPFNKYRRFLPYVLGFVIALAFSEAKSMWTQRVAEVAWKAGVMATVIDCNNLPTAEYMRRENEIMRACFPLGRGRGTGFNYGRCRQFIEDHKWEYMPGYRPCKADLR